MHFGTLFCVRAMEVVIFCQILKIRVKIVPYLELLMKLLEANIVSNFSEKLQYFT